MKRELITVSIPPEWLPLIKSKANNQSCYINHYVKELIRQDLGQPPSVTTFNRAPRYETVKTPAVSLHSKKMQVLLPRKAQDIVMGMVLQTGWSISTVVSRIIEVDILPSTSKQVIRRVNSKQLVREYSEAGKALGAEHWVEYYKEHPKSAEYNLTFYLPLDWQDALQAKADLSATTPYLLVREALMKRFFGKDYLTADTDAA